ncbi:NAD(P)-dependent oxidoreductase [Kutzneria sp. CA-103260]|uniref:NAD(P)-dependent oxidoreductase n=1 Tax=Kutzneria sp. CA-103260 TaxID=2802641 RepID=UPI001BAA3350|nr:SDR family oxidoreductase [Kutzneria sp. CA-103260]QUQ72289.1 NAD-dependent epimerase/dehydratase family protein [Kutzneria sp. CA-103260]
MKITVFAATGGIGRCVLDQALAAGHEVTAVVRDPSKVPSTVHTVRADLSTVEPGVLETAVGGADAVLSGLGPRNARQPNAITSAGTKAIISAMKATGARRIVVVSAAPVSTTPSPDRPNPPRHDPAEGFIMRNVLTPGIRRLFHDHYTDLAIMEDALRASGLDWTSVRPPKLTDKPLTGQYRLAHEQNIRSGATISRADVAHYMLACLDDPSSIGHCVGIAT